MSNSTPIDDIDADAIETAKAVRASKRKGVRTLPEFITACEDGGYERIGGVMVDAFTKSMVCQIWAVIEKHPKADELKGKLNQRFDKIVETGGGGVLGTRPAIVDVVDRFWKMARPAK